MVLGKIIVLSLSCSGVNAMRNTRPSPTDKIALDSPEEYEPEVGLTNYGVFSGVVVDREFPDAPFWGRHGEVIKVAHGVDGGLSLAAEYSTNTGVSDLVYYAVHPDHFCVGCGRGTGWKNDEKLAAEYAGYGASYYATRADYKGVGHFKLDRGHQAPVASFNSIEVEADLTNIPTNLSPQSARLNQGPWVAVEKEVRDKARKFHDSFGYDSFEKMPTDFDEASDVLEVLTGPLYQLPTAMLQAPSAHAAWKQLLVDGKTEYDAKKKQKKRTLVPWCPKATANHSVFEDAENKRPRMTCEVQSSATAEDPRDDPNSLNIQFHAGKKSSTGLRVPLGYFKLFAIPKGSRYGRRTCAFIMDQVGQCMVTSVEVLAEVAHLDLSKTSLAKIAGGVGNMPSDDAKYTTKVNPFWCVPPHTALGRNRLCEYATKKTSVDQIDEALIERYWSRMKAAGM